MEDMMNELELTPLQAVQLIKAMAEGLEKYLSSPISLVVKEPDPKVWGEDEWPEGKVYFLNQFGIINLSYSDSPDRVVAVESDAAWLMERIYFVSDVDPRI